MQVNLVIHIIKHIDLFNQEMIKDIIMHEITAMGTFDIIVSLKNTDYQISSDSVLGHIFNECISMLNEESAFHLIDLILCIIEKASDPSNLFNEESLKQFIDTMCQPFISATQFFKMVEIFNGYKKR